ncbi:unnamed protein product [Notodromas monacha]|uniref:FIP-RBD domain-containing protein n=1 Tax=Notodromas monacha TaxID=399045 RepID=A0A7R9BGL3_9CRUS|nr:unnamed protein product [Notodromas monacha]CAG0914025.1 unnamed protein product [Notodromas monacha]
MFEDESLRFKKVFDALLLREFGQGTWEKFDVRSGSLNRSSSFNSSGRGSGGSGCDGEEPYSDVSLEEDVIDLNHKVSLPLCFDDNERFRILVNLLQEQISALADNQNTTDDRYQKVKHENSTLNSRIQMLEEQLRELEMRGEDQLVSEQKRCRELVARIEREKQLELENYQVRLQSMEQKGTSLERELERMHHQADLLKQEKARAVAERDEAESALQNLQSEHQSLRDLYRKQLEQFSNEKQLTNEVLQEMSRELESLRSEKDVKSMVCNGGQRRGISPSSGSGFSCTDEEECTDGKRRRRRRKRRGENRVDNHSSAHSETTSSRLRDLEDELRRLREENKGLVEQKEELQAQLLSSGLDQGRELLNQSALGGEASLAMELEELSTDEVACDSSAYSVSFVKFLESSSFFGFYLTCDEQMKEALKEQKEVNFRLRAYIDGILLNIVEHYPQLLEIKTPSPAADEGVTAFSGHPFRKEQLAWKISSIAVNELGSVQSPLPDKGGLAI